MNHPIIHVDFETRSSASLQKLGTWAYSLDASTDIWCMSYATDADDVRTWLPGDPVPDIFTEPFVLAAHNYRFEAAIWANVLMPRYAFPAAPAAYRCTMVTAMRRNLPAALATLAERLGVDQKKDVTASRMMVRMANRKTYEPTKAGSTAHKNHAENMKTLIAYCEQDVRTEMAIEKCFGGFPVDSTEFRLDQKINDNGVYCDVAAAKTIDKAVHQEAKRQAERLPELTGGEVTTGRQQAKMLGWLQTQGYPGNDLQAGTVRASLASPSGMTTEAMEVLRIRQTLALGSLAKYGVIATAADPSDNRMRGLFQLYGASQTGRWAGRLVQFQNLPRMSLSDESIESILKMFELGNLDAIRVIFGDPLEIAKRMIRPMFCAPEGKVLIVSDLAQIECRVAAWLAGCTKLIDLFADSNRDPYSEMAGEIYHRPATEFGKGTEGRQLGKACILGAGYGMGKDKFAETVRSTIGIELDVQQSGQIIDTYRSAFVEIPAFWRALDRAFADVTVDRVNPVRTVGKVLIRRNANTGEVVVTLPSGRTLHYPNLKFDPKENSLTFLTAKNAEGYLYGGKLCENITQAVARDVLMDAMIRLDEDGHKIVGHVHDEVLVEGEPKALATVNQIMSTNPGWADSDLPLEAETHFSRRYTK